MKSQIKKIQQLSSDQSVVCILGSDQIPDKLKLSKQEKDFVIAQIEADVEKIYINSYNRFIYIVTLKKDIPHYKVREELRKTAYKLKKQIRDNNHNEMIIN